MNNEESVIYISNTLMAKLTDYAESHNMSSDKAAEILLTEKLAQNVRT